MKKYYETPELEIEKFSVAPSVFTTSTSSGWGEGGDSGTFEDEQQGTF
ncbi:MAG: hypothetical protein NC213_02115 [Acetobacter sp.]|nr:hypothetical protein [Bacteroides sp.]MCM1340515.1 hypothetical protein [Acetobacter sp.]MCM1433255.1 hypothetical protein [Clostridiales bacterium]